LLVIETKLEFEGSIGYATATAEQLYDLIEHGVKVHHGTPSNRFSFRATLGCHKYAMKERAVAEASRGDGARPVWQAVGYWLVPLSEQA
jgi:hypothetical protein